MATASRLTGVRVLLAGVLASLAALLLPATPALACSCAEPLPVAEARDQADAVFTGRVIEMSRTGRQPQQQYQVRFAVSTTWKGIDTSEVIVSTHVHGATCGYGFDEGREYLVYARGEDGLSTNLCTRTVPLTGASEDLAALGEGRAGAALPAPPAADRGAPWAALTEHPGRSIAFALVVAVALLLAWVEWRQPRT